MVGPTITGGPVFIDAHTHAFLREDLGVLSRRLTMLDDVLKDDDPHKWRLHGDGTLEDLVARQRALGADRFVLLPMTGKPARVGELNRWSAEAAQTYPEVIPFAIMHPEGDVAADLQAAVALGLKGVKLHPFIQRFELDHPGVQRLFELLPETGLPVILDTVHIRGLLKAKPHLEWVVRMLNQRGCEPTEIAALAAAHPRVPIIAAHGGSLYGWHKLDPLMELDNVYFDISYISYLIEPARLVEIIRTKGVERIIYGSDSPWRDPAKFRAWFDELELGPEERRAITAGNILSLID